MKQCAASFVPVARVLRISLPFWPAAACSRSVLLWASVALGIILVLVFSTIELRLRDLTDIFVCGAEQGQPMNTCSVEECLVYRAQILEASKVS